MNFLIGKWTDDTLYRKEQILFYLSTHKIQYQRGSIQYKEIRHSRIWEYSTAIELSNVLQANAKNTKILDVGGCGSLLDYYLGYNGFNIICIDLLEENVDLANENNRNLGYNIINKKIDITTLPFKEEFDFIFSINTIEHVMEHARKNFIPGSDVYWGKHNPSNEEKEKEKLFIDGCAKALKPGGLLVISYDYKSEGIYKCQPKCAYMRSKEDVEERIIKTSGLTPVGELNFDYNEFKGFDPPASTGIVFLRK